MLTGPWGSRAPRRGPGSAKGLQRRPRVPPVAVSSEADSDTEHERPRRRDTGVPTGLQTNHMSRPFPGTLGRKTKDSWSSGVQGGGWGASGMTLGLLAWPHLCLRCERWALTHTVRSPSDSGRGTPEDAVGTRSLSRALQSAVTVTRLPVAPDSPVPFPGSFPSVGGGVQMDGKGRADRGSGSLPSSVGLSRVLRTWSFSVNTTDPGTRFLFLML